MCAIFGSFDHQTLKQLRDLNAYRGEISGSLASLSIDYAVVTRFRGKIPDELFEFPMIPDTYSLGHVQAPTTEAEDIESIHPAQSVDLFMNRNLMLWHNGIIKQAEIERLNKKLGTNYKWDTALLLALFREYGFDAFSEVVGSFSCVLSICNAIPSHNTVYVFRNEISPLFVDNNLNISSTKFEGSYPTDAGVVYTMDIAKRQLTPTRYKFKTAENPFYFG